MTFLQFMVLAGRLLTIHQKIRLFPFVPLQAFVGFGRVSGVTLGGKVDEVVVEIRILQVWKSICSFTDTLKAPRGHYSDLLCLIY